MPEHAPGAPPLVSIGLPVRNGERYLETAIDSLLAQTFSDLELVICDNASVDGTADICRRAAARDPRVRYHRNDTDIGGAANHNLTFALSRGRYFRWAAHDDLVEPELIERCVKVLETEPDVVLCHTDLAHIDADGRAIAHISRNHGTSTCPSERFATVAQARDFCEESYALIRSEVFAATRLQQPYTGSDRTLVAELALRGRFANVEECLFRKRLHPQNAYVDWRTRMAWFGDAYRGRVTLPFWIQLADYGRAVRRVPLTSGERWRCHVVMMRWVASHAHNLGKDVVVAGLTLARPRERRVRHARLTENWA
jgi:glycosyltransferase involved in cell wall biosynthesis